VIIADQDARDRALDVSASFAVSAPAGSGKTGLLIRRILRLLVICEQPEQVLAITFTRKAAAEMEERILQALTLAADDTPPADPYQAELWRDARRVRERDKAHNWQLNTSPARLRITTIDGLCRTLARQLALETGLGDLPEPSEQPQFFYRDAIRQLLRDLDSPGPLGDALAVLLRHLDNNLTTLERLLENLLASREQWLEPLLASRDARRYLEQTLHNTVSETLAEAESQLALVASDLALVADYAAANLARDNPASPLCALAGISGLPDTEATQANVRQWLALCDLLLTADGDWRKPRGITKRQGFPTRKDAIDPANAELRKDQLNQLIAWCEEQPGLLALLCDIRHLPALVYSDDQWRLLEALTLVLPRLVAELSLLFKARRSCDFTEVTLAALSALGNDDQATDLSLRLDYQIRHILVDEFQDTSSIQFRLLKRLTWGWQRDDGRTLFIVGDGMQSLYGFRNANVGIFLEARKLPVGDILLKPLDLEVNFRSAAQVVNWVNGVFKQVFPEREDISRGAVSYAPAVAAKAPLDEAAVTLDVFPADSAAEDEAREVVARIRAAHAEDPQGSIAVLVRARSHLPAIISALREQDIAWEATDIDALASRMAVIDLFSLTRALLDPADRIAWLAVLRAPWCGLSLSDLHTLAQGGSRLDANPRDLPWLPGQLFDASLRHGLSDDGQARLTRVARVVENAWHNRFRKPLRQWLEGVWIALGGPAALADRLHLAWCQQFLDLLETHARGAELADMDAFRTAVEKLFASSGSSGENPVQIMTIHKSKGLEFDTVILPGLHRGSGRDDSTLLYWRERINARGVTELLIAPPLSEEERHDSGNDDQLVRHLKYEDKLRGSLEDARVLYVACTRAIKRLHLLYSEPRKAPVKGSLLAALWPALENPDAMSGTRITHHDASMPDEAQADDGPPGLRHIMRLPSQWRHPLHDMGDTLRPAAPAAPIVGTTNDDLRHAGTALHRTLCQIVGEGLDKWNEERLAHQHKAWLVQFRKWGVADGEAQANQLRDAVATTLADPQGRWLLDSNHAESACELALVSATESGYEQAVLDRTFVDGGVRWIIDYKNSTLRDGETQNAFVARESNAYRGQLERYKALFRHREDREIRIALYFPRLAHLHVLE